jgi:beta-1,4-N-acetylglucosaminyltransferase
MKVALVCSHGGHLTETLQVLDGFKGHEIFFATHYSARDDEIRAIAPAYFCKNIGERIYLFAWAFLWALWIIVREQPHVIFSTGSEIALPFYFWAKLFGKKTIFLESWCRVKTPSQTARLAYHLVDEFWVQWPHLAAECGPKAKYFGAVI